MVGWGDPQDETNDGGLGFEVVPGLGVGNMPNNPNTIIDHGFGLEVGNSFGVSSTDTDKGMEVEQRLDIEIEKQLKKPSKDGNEPDEVVKADMFQFRKIDQGGRGGSQEDIQEHVQVVEGGAHCHYDRG